MAFSIMFEEEDDQDTPETRPVLDLQGRVHPVVEMKTGTQTVERTRNLTSFRELIFQAFENQYLATLGEPKPLVLNPDVLTKLDSTLGNWLKLENDRIAELRALIAKLGATQE